MKEVHLKLVPIYILRGKYFKMQVWSVAATLNKNQMAVFYIPQILRRRHLYFLSQLQVKTAKKKKRFLLFESRVYLFRKWGQHTVRWLHQIVVLKTLKGNLAILWLLLNPLPQWSTSNWRSSQRWLLRRAAAHASTLWSRPACLPPTNSFSLCGHSLHPPWWRNTLFLSPSSQLSDFSK